MKTVSDKPFKGNITMVVPEQPKEQICLHKSFRQIVNKKIFEREIIQKVQKVDNKLAKRYAFGGYEADGQI